MAIHVGGLSAAIPSDPELSALAGLTSAADQLPYFTGSGAAALTTLTTAGRALLDDPDTTTMLTTLFGTYVAPTAYTPTITSSSGTVTGATITTTARYFQTGKRVDWRATITITSVGSGTPGGSINFSIPVAPFASVSTPMAAFNGGSGVSMCAYISAGASVVSLGKADGTTAWAPGTYGVAGVYEAA